MTGHLPAERRPARPLAAQGPLPARGPAVWPGISASPATPPAPGNGAESPALASLPSHTPVPAPCGLLEPVFDPEEFSIILSVPKWAVWGSPIPGLARRGLGRNGCPGRPDSKTVVPPPESFSSVLPRVTPEMRLEGVGSGSPPRVFSCSTQRASVLREDSAGNAALHREAACGCEAGRAVHKYPALNEERTRGCRVGFVAYVDSCQDVYLKWDPL